MNLFKNINNFRNILSNSYVQSKISLNQYNSIILRRHVSHIVYEENISSIQNKLSEKQNLLIAKNDPDLFGTLSPSNILNEVDRDDDDLKEEEFLDSPPSNSQKLRTKQYADMIKEHLKNKQIAEAINVLEERMLKTDRVKPENYIYNLLISGCARAGYSKKSFQLYNKMKQRGLKITGGTYTSLFNACALTPWKNDGLNKANRLREIMLEKGYEPNDSNYNAMIKAYGRCGDILTAFKLVDEMKTKNLEIRTDTFNFLLQACASDKELGFRHAIIVWHKMLNRKIRPDIYSFNLLLRCTRDCEIGNIEMFKQVIDDVVQVNQTFSTDEKNRKIMYSISTSDNNEILVNNEKHKNFELETVPNIISKTPHFGNIIELNEIQKPEERFLLIGGITGFLYEMEKSKVTPNLKTFTELLEVIPATLAAEKKIISIIRLLGIKTDVDFFNILIKKRSMRFDYNSAKEVLSMIKTAKLEPDIVTYGILALGCQTAEEADELLEELKKKEIRMNIQILGAMLKQGCYQKNFDYIIHIIDLVRNERIKPNAHFIQHLDKFDKYTRSLIKSRHPSVTKKFKSDLNRFNKKYEKFQEDNGIVGLKLEDAIKKITEHPYEQFKTIQKDGYEKLKGEKLRHEKKVQRYINPYKLKKYEENRSKNVIE